MTLPNIFEVTRVYLYGRDNIPTNFFSNDMLIRGSVPGIRVELSDIFDPISGPARFANASTSPIVSTFFEWASFYFTNGDFDYLKNDLGEIELSKEEALTAFGLATTDNGIYVDNKDFVDGNDDYASRVYIWGTMAFKLGDVVFKISADGVPTIENFSIVLRLEEENFDWNGGSF